MIIEYTEYINYLILNSYLFIIIRVDLDWLANYKTTKIYRVPLQFNPH